MQAGGRRMANFRRAESAARDRDASRGPTAARPAHHTPQPRAHNALRTNFTDILTESRTLLIKIRRAVVPLLRMNISPIAVRSNTPKASERTRSLYGFARFPWIENIASQTGKLLSLDMSLFNLYPVYADKIVVDFAEYNSPKLNNKLRINKSEYIASIYNGHSVRLILLISGNVWLYS